MVEVDLPERVVTAFEAWWDAYRQSQVQTVDGLVETASGGQRFRAPSLLLDPVTAEVMAHLPIQRYVASGAGERAHITMFGSVSANQGQAVDLRTYASIGGLVETQDCQISLRFPDEEYQFSLESDGRVVRRSHARPWSRDPGRFP